VVEGAGRLHPLLGRFGPEHAPALDAAAAEGAPVVRTVRALGAAVVAGAALAAYGDPAAYLVNVNRPEDQAAAQEPGGDRRPATSRCRP
jgi:molybdopterin-guanine dinucleotide biosynthesis protein A